MSKTVVVTGAGGFVGSAVVEALAAAGHSVRALSRTGSGPQRRGVTHHPYDLAHAPDPSLFAGADVVVHAAWALAGRDAVRLNVSAAAALAQRAGESGIKTVFLSSFAAVENVTSGYGRAKRDAEAIFDGAGGVILRPGLVVGSGGMFARMVHAVAERRVVPLIGANRPNHVIDVEDVSSTILRLVEHPRSGTFWLAQPEPIRMLRLYRLLIELTAHSPILVPLPASMAIGVASLAERIGLALPISADSVRGLQRLAVRDTFADLVCLGVARTDPADIVRCRGAALLRST